MADDADITQDRAEHEAALLAAARAHRKPGLIPVLCCHFCSSELAPGHLFCDAYCRDDYEAEQRAKDRNGRR